MIEYPRINARKVWHPTVENTDFILDNLLDKSNRPFEPTDAQLPLLNDQTRFQTWLMGRRAGKTTTAAVKIIIEAMIPYKRIWIVAPFYDLCQRIFSMVVQYMTRPPFDCMIARLSNS